MEGDLINFLKSHKLFTAIDEKSFQKILPKFTKIDLPAGKYLFHQGEMSDSVYILAKGKLAALLTTSNHPIKTVGHIEVGETVGEMGALSKEPRSLTIRALRDSMLFQIKNMDLIDLCYHYPSILFEMIHPVITRSQNIIHMLTAEKEISTITLVPANPNINLDNFIKKFHHHSLNFPNLILISDLQPEYNHLSFSRLKEIISTIEHEKKTTQKIIFLIYSLKSPLLDLCIKKTDRLYIVGDSQLTAEIDTQILDYIYSPKSHLTVNPDLVLLHPRETKMPINSSHWLQQTQFNLHHHVIINKTRHYQRLLRFIRGKAIGLVLGGGGTRGWAHLGVLRALRKEHIPIDFIGGTSVGGLIAACYAMRESFQDTYEKFSQIVKNSEGSVSWRSLTWPIISIFDGKKFTNSQIDTFKACHIEDLWLPFFCISSNLANYAEEIHHRGLLWERIRASTAMPGVIPPMILNGELHLDGGLLNNLPVDIMRQFVGKKGKIIAVELNTALHDYRRYRFPPIIDLKTALLTKFRLNPEKNRFPRFIDTFMRGMLVGSSAKTKMNGLTADLLINLNLSQFPLLHANHFQGEKMMALAFNETLIKIAEAKK